MAFWGGHHGLWHHILLDLIMVVFRTINYHIFVSYVHKGMGKVNFLGENLSNGDKIEVKFKWIFCHPKQKNSTNFAILRWNIFWDMHHCDCITQSRKINWTRVQV